jgi:hypothetical protein
MMKVPAMMNLSAMVSFHVMEPCGLMKLSSAPMMHGVFSVPRVTVPVVTTAPIPPMATELTVVYPMISWRQSEDIVRWNNPDRRRDKGWLDESPGTVVDSSPEPVTLMEAEPSAIEKIETYRVRDQIDIAFFTGNHYDIGRRWKYQRWGRRNVNANAHLGPTDRCHANDKKKTDHK